MSLSPPAFDSAVASKPACWFPYLSNTLFPTTSETSDRFGHISSANRPIVEPFARTASPHRIPSVYIDETLLRPHIIALWPYLHPQSTPLSCTHRSFAPYLRPLRSDYVIETRDLTATRCSFIPSNSRSDICHIRRARALSVPSAHLRHFNFAVRFTHISANSCRIVKPFTPINPPSSNPSCPTIQNCLSHA